ncbi:hypothetical protein Tco_1284542 [Tanacetum coccineum]
MARLWRVEWCGGDETASVTWDSASELATTPNALYVSISLHSNSQMANFSAKYSIMTQEMVDSFCESFYIPAEVHPTAPGRDKTIAQFPAEKDPAPHLTARQEQTVKLLESHKAPFRRYPECFLCLVGLSPYYPFDDNSYPAFERPDGTDMGLLDFIKTADPRKVRAVEVQKGDDQVTLLESTRHCFMPLVIPAAGGSSSVAATEIPAPTERGQEGVAEENAYLELADPDEGTAMVRQSDEEVKPLLHVELKEKLNAKYVARGKLLEEKDTEILRLKSQLAEKEAEAAEVVRLHDQSSLSGEKSALTAEVSALKVTLSQKDQDISLLDSCATHLESAPQPLHVSHVWNGHA